MCALLMYDWGGKGENGEPAAEEEMPDANEDEFEVKVTVKAALPLWSVHVYMCVHIYVCVCMCVHIYVCMYVRAYFYACVCVCV
jgi:hypothetical protein